MNYGIIKLDLTSEEWQMGWLGSKTANIVDLFSGTGGMGLASLLVPQLAGRARIVLAAEIDPEYLRTIRLNFDYFSTHIGDKEQIPTDLQPLDVTSPQTISRLRSLRRRYGEITLLLAGPPCQGFSMSNRRSRGRGNPLNKLVLAGAAAIRAARPRIAILENVPGIRVIPSPTRPKLSMTEHLELELQEAGYRTVTTLLDAADYGVPQHRLRSFTIAVDKTIQESFGEMVPIGTFGEGRSRPYRTVRDAFSDLPLIGSGSASVVSSYLGPPSSSLQRELRQHCRLVYDHVTTNHSTLVLGRYASIPPGGNWRSIRRKLETYSDVENTHTNIYRRLHPDLPAGTVGNFRKSMTVHPWEHRGLTLREAARLQSLPDWFRFFRDDAQIRGGQLQGLSFRQQQVGNAVCFRLTKRLVSHLLADA